MDRRDQVATAAFVFVALAAGFVTMVVPLLFHVSPGVAWWLFWGGLCLGVIALVVGLVALFRRQRPRATTVDESVTSHGQTGGITARNVNFKNDRQ